MTWLTSKTVLLLDAGNTLVYLDHQALADAAREEGSLVTARALAEAEPAAKRRYEASVRAGASHADGWDLHMRVIYELAGLSEQDACRAALAAKREHDRFNLWRSVPEGLHEALAGAQRGGLRLGVVSNSEGKLDALFARVGLDSYFELVVDSALEGVRKPDPEIFRRALTRMRVQPEAAVYAGDIPEVDVDGARAAGMDAVLIDGRNHYREYRAAPRFASVCELLVAMGR